MRKNQTIEDRPRNIQKLSSLTVLSSACGSFSPYSIFLIFEHTQAIMMNVMVMKISISTIDMKIRASSFSFKRRYTEQFTKTQRYTPEVALSTSVLSRMTMMSVLFSLFGFAFLPLPQLYICTTSYELLLEQPKQQVVSCKLFIALLKHAVQLPIGTVVTTSKGHTRTLKPSRAPRMKH